MLAKDLISEVVPALKTSDTGLRALSWMEIFRISHLPIVNNKEFLGLISDTDIYDLNMANEPIGNHHLSLFSPFVTSDQHIYEIIELVSRLKLTVVPVLNKKKDYLGLITLNDLVQYVADLFALKEPGGIIVLELHQNDYSLNQISQIVEGNNAKILSMYLTSPSDSMKMELTLKINQNDLTSIIHTFERYDYTIKASYMEDEDMDSFYSNRYESFMKYLNI
ncbi:MAG: CBS domain-containing protein [Bacteroidales bacterium]|nr:CBS domain-containing protein [Bacteroidales bacterium]